jgi:hypothetical protein
VSGSPAEPAPSHIRLTDCADGGGLGGPAWDYYQGRTGGRDLLAVSSPAGGQGVAGSNPVVPTARWAVPSARGSRPSAFPPARTSILAILRLSSKRSWFRGSVSRCTPNWSKIWSTPSGAAKWGQGLLQVCGVVLVTSDRLGSVRDGLVRRRLGCRRGGVPSSRGRVAGFAAAGAYAARSGAAARGAGFAPGSARWMGTGTWFGSSSRFGVDVAPGHRSVLEASMRGAMGRCRGHHVGAARAPFRDLPGRVICVPCQGRKHVRHMCCRTT